MWEVARSNTDKCWCGKGTITYSMEMDDWNRTRNSREIHCPACLKKAQAEEKRRALKEKKKEALYRNARKIAIKRYLKAWLNLFVGLSKKAAWERYTGKDRYPALGTFYKHVKDHGDLAAYMQWSFEADFERALAVMAVKDAEIQALIRERESL